MGSNSFQGVKPANANGRAGGISSGEGMLRVLVQFVLACDLGRVLAAEFPEQPRVNQELAES
jgi:hypothetical protein